MKKGVTFAMIFTGTILSVFVINIALFAMIPEYHDALVAAVSTSRIPVVRADQSMEIDGAVIKAVPVVSKDASNNESVINGITVNDNLLNGNTLNVNALSGNAINGNAVNGNVLNGNALNGNTINGNTLNGNALNGNTLDGNALNGNTLNGNHVNENDMNRNTMKEKDADADSDSMGTNPGQLLIPEDVLLDYESTITPLAATPDSSTEKKAVIIDKEYHEDCGTGKGYWVITYSDGSTIIE